MFQTFLEKGRRNLGYTIDQTILVVAVIAILITLIIASVGWDLITRAGGTKLASYLKQVEDAHGSFYGTHGMWVDVALDSDGNTASSPEDNLRVLQENLFDNTPTRFFTNHQNLLPGFTNDGINLLSPFGDGLQLMTFERLNHATDPISDSFVTGSSWVLNVQGVPEEEAMQADSGVDGQDDISTGNSDGRVILVSDPGLCDGTDGAAIAGDLLVTICYIANSIN